MFDYQQPTLRQRKSNTTRDSDDHHQRQRASMPNSPCHRRAVSVLEDVARCLDTHHPPRDPLSHPKTPTYPPMAPTLAPECGTLGMDPESSVAPTVAPCVDLPPNLTLLVTPHTTHCWSHHTPHTAGHTTQHHCWSQRATSLTAPTRAHTLRPTHEHGHGSEEHSNLRQGPSQISYHQHTEIPCPTLTDLIGREQ